MKRVLPAMFAATLAVCCFNASAQTDSTHFDLGRVKLKKDFTQHITIKGSDLERMPFSHLTDALNVWLQGVYTSYYSLQYVVDGVLAPNVDQYSVYDIEEVTLVQHAAIQVNGAADQQHLILIKTKRGGPGKCGITVAGQSFLSKNDKPYQPSDYEKSESKFYHQVHLAAYRNAKNIQYGVSANLLRDVMPYYKNTGREGDPNPTINRFRFNGWLEAQLGAKNRLSFSMSYVPQPAREEYFFSSTFIADSSTLKTKEHIINPTITLRSAWVKNLHNELSFSYTSGYYKNEYAQRYVNFTLANPNYTLHDANRTIKSTNIVASNHTTYNIQAGNWQIEPALDLMFRYIELSEKYSSVTRSVINAGPFPNISTVNISSEGLRRLFLLTPSVNLYFKNVLNLQGGLVYDASDYNKAKYKKVYPFASVSVNALKLAAPGTASSLKIYGSWAQSALLADYSALLTDHATRDKYSARYTPYLDPVLGVTPVYSPEAPDSSTWIIQAGASFNTPNDRLVVNYNYEKRDFTPLSYRFLAGPWGPQLTVYYPVFNASTHRLGLLAKVIDGKKFNWYSGLNVTTIKLTSDDSNAGGTLAKGDFQTEDPSWTGGFTNRLSYGGFKLGVDLLYHFDQELPAMLDTYKNNTVVLQNVYAGYAFKLPKGRNMEVHADCRNLTRNEKSVLRDRKFYGLGLKAQL